MRASETWKTRHWRERSSVTTAIAQWLVALDGLEMTTIDRLELVSSSTSWAVSHVVLVAERSARSRRRNACSVVVGLGLAPYGVDGRTCGGVRGSEERESGTPLLACPWFYGLRMSDEWLSALGIVA